MTEGTDGERGSDADRIDVSLSPQGDRVTHYLGFMALVGWSALALAGGGVDLGSLDGGWGQTSFMAALIGGPVLAVVCLIRIRKVAWSRATSVTIGAFAALAAWSAVSIAWASRPDLAWLSANRTALALAAVVVGVAWGASQTAPARSLAVGVSLAALPVLVWSLAGRVVPDLAAPLVDTPRLTAPIGHANGLAVVAAMALPGALVWAGDIRRRRDLSVVIAAVPLLVIVLTGSRSGAIATLVTIGVALWLLPDRPRMLATLGAAAAGIVSAAWLALTADGLSGGNILPVPGQRRGIGLVLGGLIAAGIIAAIVLRPALVPVARRVSSMLTRPVAAVAVAVVVVGAAVVVWAGRGVTANDGATRVFSADSNNRSAWWGQAWRGFLDAPLAGNGAGSFPVTHLTERTADVPSLQVRQPHQLVLELLTEIGIVGLVLALVALGGVVVAAHTGRRAVGPAVCLLMPFLVTAQLDWTWAIPAATLPAMAAAGVIVAHGARGRSIRWASWGRLGTASACALVVAGGGVAAWAAKSAAWDARLLRQDFDLTAALARAERATDLNPLAIHGLMIEALVREAVDDIPGAQAAARRATTRHPDNPTPWECVAALTSGPEKSAAQEQLSQLDPARNPNRPFACIATR